MHLPRRQLVHLLSRATPLPQLRRPAPSRGALDPGSLLGALTFPVNKEKLGLQGALNLNTENLLVACESEETATELDPITMCLDPETEKLSG